MDTMQLKQQVDGLLQTGGYEKIRPLLLSCKETTEHDNDLAVICYLCTVYEQEKAAGQRTLFDKAGSFDKLLERYTTLKFYLRRVDFDVMGDMDMLYQFLSAEHISTYELLRVIDFSVVHKKKVLRRIGEGTMEEVAAGTGAVGGVVSHKASNHAGKDGIEQICFILCTNNAVYAQECIYYINQLIVPEGMEVEILTVEDAVSMTAGYNEAMRCSKAKYKVYLHHDTFIVYPYFLRDLLRIFQSDKKIGMVGVIGAPHIPENGIMWDAKRYGMIYEQHIYETVMLSNACTQQIEEVEAVDGLLMATQYDIPWREDLFDQWDFYDCSQSMEFNRHGYKVVVPQTETPWCVHDCGFLNLENYDGERQKFLAEYMSDREG